MDDLMPEIQRLIEAKEMRRRELSRLPFPQKVRIIVQLQNIAAPLFRARGKNVRVWKPED